MLTTMLTMPEEISCFQAQALVPKAPTIMPTWHSLL